jgi:hypothetical protein
MSINHYIDPDIEPKLDLYAKSITLEKGRVDAFKQYVTNLVEVTSPQYYENINLNNTIVEVTPIKDNYAFDGDFNRNHITMKIAGTLDVVNLPIGINSQIVVDWTNFNNSETDTNFDFVSFRYGDCSIQTRQGTLMSGDVFTQHIPLFDVSTSSLTDCTFNFSPIKTGADVGTYSCLPNNPFEITIEFNSLFEKFGP